MMCLQSALFVRILSRNRDVYLLKVITLAVAFAASILVTLFSTHEFGYDTNHENADRVFRMLARNTDKDYTGNRLSASIPKAILKRISEQFSDLVTISRVKALNKVTIIMVNLPGSVECVVAHFNDNFRVTCRLFDLRTHGKPGARQSKGDCCAPSFWSKITRRHSFTRT